LHKDVRSIPVLCLAYAAAYSIDDLDVDYIGQHHIRDDIKRLLRKRAQGLYKHGEALWYVAHCFRT
jgi:hypothetical protein